MTTKVKIECPDTSHWHVRVKTQDKLYDPKSQKYVPNEFTTVDTFVLKQGEAREVYIHSSRRLVIEEIESAAEAGAA